MAARSTQVPPFTALAPLYDRIGFGADAMRAAQCFLAYMQEQGWAGRRIVDIGCRTGEVSMWLAQQGYRVTGVDEHPTLLKIAASRLNTRELDLTNAPDWIECDLRALDNIPGPADLVLAADGVLNRAASLREVEAMLSGIYHLLDEQKGLIFDIETIGGLAASDQSSTITLYDDPQEMTILARPHFSFETLSRTTHLTIWQRTSGGWQRADEFHTARGFPVHAIRAVLERCGFTLQALLDNEMQPVDPGADPPARVVFVAAK